MKFLSLSFFLLAILVSSSFCFSWRYTTEFLYTGKGDVNEAILDQSDGSFCYLVEGRKFEKGSESCSVSVGSSHGTNSWEVYKKSDKKKFMCGVQCVQMNGQNIVLGETLLSGKGTQEVPLSPTTNAFCFLVNARAWYEKDEICRITKTNNDTQWALSTESKQSKFQCGGQCVVVKDPAANVTVHDEVVVKGKVDEGQGKGEKELGVGAQEGFCFITRARSWTGSGEHCQVTAQNAQWLLVYESGKKHFECGATCVTFS